ncbi:MAG TPA: imidazolonepropionase [Piscinibacter sp.]|uniref:imidazolonepropionase n=1 Tax=Piscinibacter sp. TaxID=1903157 RepID=UPI002BD08BF1|nr:imidazolonepropionase [Piscinibacter sp.]
MSPGIDLLLRNVRIVTCTDDACSITPPAFLAVLGGHIAGLGPMSQLDPAARAQREIDAQGALLTPGLIDCHTHLVYAGHRAREFEMRLQGASYEEIARAGGGIVSTVKLTREAVTADLYAQSARRAQQLMAHGVTTVEVKSGYGLSLKDELKCLHVARELGEHLPLTVRATLLAAHALPPEYAGRSDDYIAHVAEHIVPEAARLRLADAVDAFCENIAFDLLQTRQVFEAAKRAGLPVKLHAEQLSNMHGAALAAEFDALSADHLEHVDEAGVMAMARAGTVAVMLPGAFYFLRDTNVPPIALFRKHGVPMAVATDCNPGSSPTTHLPLMMNMACTLFRLTPAEALLGVTRHAAQALGLADTHGSIELGKVADFCLWDVDHPAELAYTIAASPLRARFHGGRDHLA